MVPAKEIHTQVNCNHDNGYTYLEYLKMNFRSCVSVRDLLSWVTFMNTVSAKLTQPASYYHGARLVFIDSLMSENGDLQKLNRDKNICIQYLEDQLVAKRLYDSVDIDVTNNEVELTCDQKFGIEPFYIPIGGLYLIL